MKKQYSVNRKQVIERFIKRELAAVTPYLILENLDGSVELFGKYRIVTGTAGFLVQVGADQIGPFTSKKIATSWCSAVQHHDHMLAQQLLTIDHALDALDADIVARQSAACKKSRNRDHIRTKLEPKIARRKSLRDQLTKCVGWAKYLQRKGFQNENARTGIIV